MTTIEQWVQDETAPKTVKLWGEKTTFTPVICSTVFGDGLQLIYIQPCGSRPFYWLGRVDSQNTLEDFDRDIEPILCAIEDEFGRIAECEIDEDLPEYPVICWDGGSWGEIVNLGQLQNQLTTFTRGVEAPQ